ncbi:hypothetical protein A2995_00420 [Candidatus Nomurabacteria bacterium RIFCSPLOWO2_01_FULL_33_24]|uniref:Peptide chain release factor domain-containing protein n=1 Tax=Candidatus Nomurabacteria bacterium RIFCSPLOWO2_01_FULL_33_24 TaxID=1801765 RepID=A0A1F6WYS1_9BACT|nr:MAG: hypothetical protein A2995_00420 [Candidatus Nomurabacteria bacterium RIFCSPLOWO2_01_FULL_33_24]
MPENKEDLKKQIKKLEDEMTNSNFWSNKQKAQETIKEISLLKEKLEGFSKYDRKGAIITILSGAGGDDAEDFSKILLEMYLKYANNSSWGISILHENRNDHGGYRNITFEVAGKGSYGILKNESGVHRLVRLSPFNAKKQRHTSFSMVEVIPKFDHEDVRGIEISEKDIRVEFSKSSGPGGQNVNKRETAVRLVHLPTNISVHLDSERTQERNRDKALALLKGKLYKRMEEEQKKTKEEMSVSKNTEIEWGNQIRSYVLHPYKLIKDHRTGIETKNIDNIIKNGQLDEFITAEKNL